MLQNELPIYFTYTIYIAKNTYALIRFEKKFNKKDLQYQQLNR